jgi:hypothetical protein
MNTSIKTLIDGFILSKPQTHKNMAIYPLTSNENEGIEYLSLRSALNAGFIEITEVSESGSVPNLAVKNIGKLPVLILDGEEVKGAKQNRVLNSTIMVAPGVTTTIPVSCVERGRWSRKSRTFTDSDQVMTSSSRRSKMSRVTESLMRHRGYDANQNIVWADVDEVSESIGIKSKTSAMSDAYKEKRSSLNEYKESFPIVTNQCGMIAVIDGKVIGIDMVSRHNPFIDMHSKLINSYAMDAYRSQKQDINVAEASEFLDRLIRSIESVHASAGMGNDHRLSGKHIVGSALVVDDTAVHLTAFHKPESKKEKEKPEDFGPIIYRD